LDYIIYQELFQIAIIIYNNKIKAENNQWFYPLKNTFGQLNSSRDFSHIKKDDANKYLRDEYISKKNYRENNSLLWYSLCIKKINNIITHTSEENINQDKEHIELTAENIENKLDNSLFYTSLKQSIKKYLELELKISYNSDTIWLYFIDSIWQQQTIHTISHGEKSLLIILLTIYWYDLKNWLLIIDEPEIHFHPQMQKRLAKMLEKLNENIGTQCIISTYSPIFIDEKNITNVYRFSKKNWETEIKIKAIKAWATAILINIWYKKIWKINLTIN
jgi:predicted ATP-dependent endonuclease of OLD family